MSLILLQVGSYTIYSLYVNLMNNVWSLSVMATINQDSQ